MPKPHKPTNRRQFKAWLLLLLGLPGDATYQTIRDALAARLKATP